MPEDSEHGSYMVLQLQHTHDAQGILSTGTKSRLRISSISSNVIVEETLAIAYMQTSASKICKVESRYSIQHDHISCWPFESWVLDKR